jgi:beta-lactamase superfamily II metal-dependent hydrolase
MKSIFIGLLVWVSAAAAQQPTVGAALPPWAPGMLDIHQISTGRGNSALFVMPDGTTMLVDAGAAGDGIPDTDPHPDASRPPGEWIARYVARHLPSSAKGLDYALITHFHADHYGQVVAKSPLDKTGAYRLTGITQVGDAIKIGTLIDRGFPDYNYPAPITDSTMANYRRFVASQQAKGLKIERYVSGAPNQIRLLHDASKYSTFGIRNVIGNGIMWNGKGDETEALFPALAGLSKDDYPNENMCSLALRLTYGKFSYFTGGDLPGTEDPGFPPWHAPELALSDVIGHVDVHVVNQHGSMGEESVPFLRALSSKVLIIPSWAPSHPAPDVLKRIINSRLPPADRSVFVTEMRESAKIVIGRRAESVVGPGHVVVRVEPGGERYWVLLLSSKDESDNVLAVKGPFVSGK